MKKTFLKFLPIATAVLLATSCSKDDSNDNAIVNNPNGNVPQSTESVSSETATPDNTADYTLVPFTVTVNKDGNSLSKASLSSETSVDQIFITGDYLVVSNDEVLVEDAEMDITDGDGTAEAEFTGTLKVKTDAELTVGSTKFTAVLKNRNHDEYGQLLTEPKHATTLTEAFENYGYLIHKNFVYDGNTTEITLVQNTAFLVFDLGFHGAKVTVTIKGTPYTVTVSGSKDVIAVPNGAKVEAERFLTSKTVNVLTSDHNVVYKITRDASLVPDNCASGLFSVSATKQVCFSKGNLQWRYPNWVFADTPMDFCDNPDGDDDQIDYHDGIDHFNFGVWTEGGQPVNAWKLFEDIDATPKKYENYPYGSALSSGLISDLGTGWYCLSVDEWMYLMTERPDAKLKRGPATVDGQYGLVILPDEWTCPSGLTFVGGSGTGEGFSSNVYSATQWSKMDASGAVFLPAGGMRETNSYNEIKMLYANDATDYTKGYFVGYYWTSTEDDYTGGESFKINGYYVVFGESGFDFRDYNNKAWGMSVRLVRDWK